MAEGWIVSAFAGARFNVSDRAPPPPQGGQRRGFVALSGTLVPGQTGALLRSLLRG